MAQKRAANKIIGNERILSPSRAIPVKRVAMVPRVTFNSNKLGLALGRCSLIQILLVIIIMAHCESER